MADADWWEPARQRALEGFDRAYRELVRAWIGDPGFDFRSRVEALNKERDKVCRPDWIPKRRRRMASMWTVARHWSQRDIFEVNLDEPHCFGCRLTFGESDQSLRPGVRWQRSSAFLDRAHLVDHALGGLDGPQNMVPLCRPCHRLMPMFDLGEGDQAIAWVLAGGRLPVYRAMAETIIAAQ